MAMVPPALAASSFMNALPGVGSLIGAVGGLFGKKEKQSYAYDQMKYQHSLNKEMAQNSIQWRVDDAKKAGLHPLAALGAQVASSSPVSVGSYSGSSSGDRISDFGQGIGRAAQAFMDSNSRKRQELFDALEMEKKRAEINLLNAQATSVNRPTNPPLGVGATTSDASTSRVVSVPMERTFSEAGNLSKEAGSAADYTYADTPRGGLAIIPSKDVKSRIEDMFIPETQWSIRNTYLMTEPKYPSRKPPAGHYWHWSPTMQEWMPKRSGPRKYQPFFWSK